MNNHVTGRTSNFLRVHYYLALTLSTLLSSQVSVASQAGSPCGFPTWGNLINLTFGFSPCQIGLISIVLADACRFKRLDQIYSVC